MYCSTSTEIADQRHDTFIPQIIQLRRYNIAQEIQRKLSRFPNMTLADKFQQIDRLKAWLDSFRPLPPTVVAELKKLYDVRFTYNSNAIEGAILSRKVKLLLYWKTESQLAVKPDFEHLEVIGHKDALDYIEHLAQQPTAIGEWEIKQIHNLIMRAIAPVEAGCYRQLDTKAERTEYVYPPHCLLHDLMSEFITWLNSAEAVQQPIQFAAEAHLRFVSIHPFRDGNGRTGRLLMNLLLLRTGYPIVVIPNQVRKAYIDAIVEGQQQNDISPLLSLLLDAAQKSLIEMLHILSTARESRGRGLPFYEELLAFLSERSEND